MITQHNALLTLILTLDRYDNAEGRGTNMKWEMVLDAYEKVKSTMNLLIEFKENDMN
jgi:hypothetical protein